MSNPNEISWMRNQLKIKIFFFVYLTSTFAFKTYNFWSYQNAVTPPYKTPCLCFAQHTHTKNALCYFCNDFSDSRFDVTIRYTERSEPPAFRFQWEMSRKTKIPQIVCVCGLCYAYYIHTISLILSRIYLNITRTRTSRLRHIQLVVHKSHTP